MARFFCCLWLLLTTQFLWAQDLYQSPQYSDQFLFRITEKEAEDFAINAGGKSIQENVLHSLTKVIPHGESYHPQWDSTLSRGHYLLANLEGEYVNYEIHSKSSYRVEVIENNSDLVIQVWNLNGAIVNNALVTIGKKNLKFDQKTQTYISKRFVLNDFLRVEVDGFASHYKLKNTIKRKGWRKTKILYGSPLKFIYRPLRYIVLLPIHGTKSIVKQYPYGVINTTKLVFSKWTNQIACLFNSPNCRNHRRYNNKWNQYGYCITNLPKYKIGDTLKVKAFIINKKGKPFNEELELHFSGLKKSLVTQLKPYAPGGYEYQFVLHDSLDLRLDQNYSVSFRHKDNYLQNVSIRLEEYDLGRLTLKVDTETDTQYPNIPYALSIKASDENDLPILDGKIEVKITKASAGYFQEDYLFIPYLLWEHSQNLEPDEETLIAIPDSIFPRANIGYKVEVTLITSDQEILTEKLVRSFQWKKELVEIDLQEDSILIEAVINSGERPLEVVVYDDNETESKSRVILPAKIKINPQASHLYVESEWKKYSFSLNDFSAGIQVSNERTKDSLHLVVVNPRKLPFSYFLYQTETEIARGFGQELKLSCKAHSGKKYLLSVQYLWAGSIQTQHFDLPFDEQNITLSIDQPQLIFPGQTAEIEIEAKNAKGKNMAGLDLSAHGLTAKFDYQAKSPVINRKRKKAKIQKNNYSLSRVIPKWNSSIDYDFWQDKGSIGENEYYRFLFPQDDFYSTTFPARDSITQFAPFVTTHGQMQTVHVIFVDNNPVYFSWATNDRPYSFRATPGYHEIKLRTKDALIILDSIYLAAGQKTIFNTSENLIWKGKEIIPQKPNPSAKEINILSPYLFSYLDQGPQTLNYIEQGDDLVLLSNYQRYDHWEKLAGPIRPGNIVYTRFDEFKSEFYFEPFYQYDFAKGMIKMRAFGNNFKMPKQFNSYPVRNLQQEVYTLKKVDQLRKEYISRQVQQNMGYDRLFGEKTVGDLQLNLTLLEDNNNLRSILFYGLHNQKLVGVQNAKQRHCVGVNQGQYQLILLYEDASYRLYDSLEIIPNGLNFYRLSNSPKLSKDGMSEKIDSLINAGYIKNEYKTIENAKKRIERTITNKNIYSGIGKIFKGQVIDEETGEKLIGANVMVPGMVIGTTTDFDGYFEILVPYHIDELEISYVGYANNRIINLQPYEPVLVKMVDAVVLDEVVVVGYGWPRSQRDNTTSGGVITSEQIRNLPTKDIAALAATTAGISMSREGDAISIRGSRSDGTDYYIDGIRVRGSAALLPADQIQDLQVIQGAEALSVYGAAKVVLITTNKDYLNPAFYEASKNANGLRNNFSDEAFWQPRLRTDKEGKAKFAVTFPDDITKWDLHFLAVGKKNLAAQAKTTVRAIKPLSAQLSLPKFLLQNDSTLAIAKTFNYLGDSIQLKTKFSLNDSMQKEQDIALASVNIDELTISSTKADTLAVKYEIEKGDGYRDGEERELPILPLGLQIEKGVFHLIDKDSIFSINEKFDQDKPVLIYARVDQINLVRQQIDRVINYKYLCNEQLASKLLVLLRDKQLAALLQEEFVHEKKIVEIINRLLSGRNTNNLWGWWNGNAYSPWISRHVGRALMAARKAGYNLIWEDYHYATELTYRLQSATRAADKMNIMQSLLDVGAAVDQDFNFALLDTLCKSFSDRLQLQYLKAQCNTSVDLDLIKENLQTDIFGNIYMAEKKEKIDNSFNRRITQNKLQNTLLAYNILKRDTTADHGTVLEKMRTYFFANQQQGYWRNTYEASTIIETIWEDLLAEGIDPKIKPSLKITGAIDTLIKSFPFALPVQNIDALNFAYQGYQPLYFAAYQEYWQNEVEARANDMVIQTHFINNDSTTAEFAAGEKITLVADVHIKKDADFVMLEIPIPAGCSYDQKRKHFGFEVHREYFKEKVSIFCEKLPQGRYRFPIKLLAKYKGHYTLNPAKASLMYFPTFYANTAMKKVEVN